MKRLITLLAARNRDMKSLPVKSVLLLLAVIGLVISVVAAFYGESHLNVQHASGSVHQWSHREYPLVNASVGFAIFAGTSALGAALVQAAEIRANAVGSGRGVSN